MVQISYTLWELIVPINSRIVALRLNKETGDSECASVVHQI
jgi:hypothetical protein